MSNESGAVLTEKKEALEQDSAYAMTMEDYLHYEEEAFKTPNHGDIVDGVVVRVDADEVTYNLHVMLRFDLELDLLEGKLAVKDLGGKMGGKEVELFVADDGLKPEVAIQKVQELLERDKKYA